MTVMAEHPPKEYEPQFMVPLQLAVLPLPWIETEPEPSGQISAKLAVLPDAAITSRPS